MMMVCLGLHFCSAGWVGGRVATCIHYGYGYALAYVDGTAYFWVRRRAVYLDTYGGLLCSWLRRSDGDVGCAVRRQIEQRARLTGAALRRGVGAPSADALRWLRHLSCRPRRRPSAADSAQ